MVRGAVRVASVPSGHPYVENLAAPWLADGVSRLDDPPVPGAPPGRWWPSPLLDAAWVTAHADEFDLLHVHFGFEDRSVADLEDLRRALRRAGRPLVVTVHDLRNPHLSDQRRHAAALDVLVAQADEVITLTDAAAAQIRRRWGRRAEVVAHPHVASPERLGRPRPTHAGFVVGLHAKSERANNDSVAVAAVLAAALPTVPDGRLRLSAHDDEGGRAVAAAVADLASPRVTVEVHRRFSDEELCDWVSGLDVLVLPYRFGTHSGLLELCNDLGTGVLAPTCGCYAAQGPCVTYTHDDAGLDARSLADALRRSHRQRPGWRWTPEARRAQRAGIARAHRRVYLRALGR